MDKKALLIGMLAGTAAGAATALFNTPVSGREAREKVKLAQASVKSNARVIKTDVEQLKQAVTHLKDVSKDTIGEVTDGLKASAGMWKESTEPNIERLQQEIAEIQETAEDLQKALPTKEKNGEPK
ncbi:YtxH domain-containing protein [Bacillus aerolatus]|nr:YtxH domain-containing protein [Bacillus aerolatus]